MPVYAIEWNPNRLTLMAFIYEDKESHADSETADCELELRAVAEHGLVLPLRAGFAVVPQVVVVAVANPLQDRVELEEHEPGDKKRSSCAVVAVHVAIAPMVSMCWHRIARGSAVHEWPGSPQRGRACRGVGPRRSALPAPRRRLTCQQCVLAIPTCVRYMCQITRPSPGARG